MVAPYRAHQIEEAVLTLDQQHDTGRLSALLGPTVTSPFGDAPA